MTGMETWHIKENDVDEICEFIENGNFKKVGLQFPNELLKKAVAIAKQLEDKSEDCAMAIMADTTFGSCCVDEVAGQHYSVDAIVHFGPACLSGTSPQVPVKHVFGHVALDVDALRQALLALPSERRVLLFYDFVLLDSVRSAATPNCLLSLPTLRDHVTDGVGLSRCGRFLSNVDADQLEEMTLVYVGWSDLCLTNILFSFPRCREYLWFDVDKAAMAEMDRHRQLRRRLLLIEKASAAERVGLLVGTLGGSGRYMAMLDRLRRLIRERGKRCYTLMVGKLNPMKLQNFANLDCFVLVACPQNSLFDVRSAEDYSIFQPVVSPYEMEEACLPPEERSWSMEFVSDFQQLLRLKEEVEAEKAGEEEKSSAVVLAPNKLLMERNSEWTVSSHLPQRAVEEGHTWFGLDPALGQTPVTAPKPGRRGIAIEYEEEGDN